MTCTHERDTAAELREEIDGQQRNAGFLPDDVRGERADRLAQRVRHERVNVGGTQREADKVDEAERRAAPGAPDHRPRNGDGGVACLLCDVRGNVISAKRPGSRQERHAERPARRPACLVVQLRTSRVSDRTMRSVRL